MRLLDGTAECRVTQLANTKANCSKQAEQATPKGSISLLCTGMPVKMVDFHDEEFKLGEEGGRRGVRNQNMILGKSLKSKYLCIVVGHNTEDRT